MVFTGTMIKFTNKLKKNHFKTMKIDPKKVIKVEPKMIKTVFIEFEIIYVVFLLLILLYIL